MDTLTIKKEMYHAIDVIEDKDFLQAIYTLLSDKSKEYDFQLRDKDKTELDSLKKQNKAGKLSSVTIEQVRKNAYNRNR